MIQERDSRCLTIESSFDELKDTFTKMTKEMNSFILNEIDEKIMKNVLTEARCQSPLHIETEVILVDLIVNGDELIARNEIIIQKEQELNLMKE